MISYHIYICVCVSIYIYNIYVYIYIYISIYYVCMHVSSTSSQQFQSREQLNHIYLILENHKSNKLHLIHNLRMHKSLIVFPMILGQFLTFDTFLKTCNIVNSTLVSYVRVVPHPYYTKSGARTFISFSPLWCLSNNIWCMLPKKNLVYSMITTT